MEFRISEDIEELALTAFIKMQLPPHSLRRGRLSISDILQDDPWWRSLDVGTHQQIGRLIRKNFSKYGEKSPIPAYYHILSDEPGMYIHDEDYKDEKSRDLVYHYTDLSAFLGIISGTIRLSNSMTMNDKKETSYYLDHLFEATGTMLVGKEEQELDRLQTAYYLLYETPTYLMSFTENGDDAAQWERYAYGGEGVCIAFDKEALKIIAAKNAIQLDYVSYYRDYSLLPDTNDLMRYIRDKAFPRKIKNEKELFDYFGCRSALFKHPSFRSEYEYRMYYATNSYDRKPRSIKHEVTSDGRIREFYEFEWETLTRKEGFSITDVVPLVILGPKRKVDRGILQRRLDELKHSWKGEIKDSDCPLR